MDKDYNYRLENGKSCLYWGTKVTFSYNGKIYTWYNKVKEISKDNYSEKHMIYLGNDDKDTKHSAEWVLPEELLQTLQSVRHDDTD